MTAPVAIVSALPQELAANVFARFLEVASANSARVVRWLLPGI